MNPKPFCANDKRLLVLVVQYHVCVCVCAHMRVPARTCMCVCDVQNLGVKKLNQRNTGVNPDVFLVHNS